MNERIHRILDGSRGRTELTAAEREELREYEELIAAARRHVASRPVPDVTARVMNALTPSVPDRAPTWWKRLAARAGNAFRWVWAPRPVAIRPAYGLLAAVMLLALLIGQSSAGNAGSMAASEGRGAGAEAGVVRGSSAEAPIYIQFRLDAPDATEVSLAGSFTEWRPEYTLRESAPGIWTIVIPLEPGVHDYLFVVDGEKWVPDPAAQPVADGFGGTNSRLLLTSPAQDA